MRTMEQNGPFLPLLSDGPGLLCPSVLAPDSMDITL